MSLEIKNLVFLKIGYNLCLLCNKTPQLLLLFLIISQYFPILDLSGSVVHLLSACAISIFKIRLPTFFSFLWVFCQIRVHLSDFIYLNCFHFGGYFLLLLIKLHPFRLDASATLAILSQI